MSPGHAFSTIAFIDTGIEDWQSLASRLAPGVELIGLSAGEDGVKQIAGALADRSGVDAIHVISHGQPGELSLGSATLTLDTLEAYRAEWQALGRALSATGDLLLYGCEVAAGKEGQSFIDTLAGLTGADVAASDDLTGSLAGDWQLECTTGLIEAPVLFPDPHVPTPALANRAPRVTAGGSLDTSFSGDGKLTTAIGSGDDVGVAVAVQADGKILVAGYSRVGGDDDFSLARYTSSGGLDASFSGDGKLTTDLGGSDHGGAVALQADGKILVAGESRKGSDRDFALARYTPNGSLDTSFSGDGRLTTDIGSIFDEGRAVAVQADGKILLAGESQNGLDRNFALARYNPNGSLDTSFSGDGKLTTDFGSGDDSGHAVTVQADGKILVAGGSNRNFALARYNPDGSLDTTFSGDGKLTTSIGSSNDLGYAVAVQADGKILVAGESWNGSARDFALARYNPNGSLDTTFSGDGKLTTDFGSGDDFGRGVAVQADGKVLVAGSSRNGSNDNFALARYNPDGSLDTTFSSDGKLTTTIGSGDDVGRAVAVHADGRVLVAGYSVTGSGADFALACFLPGGVMDQRAVEDRAFSFTLPAKTFYDPDGDALTWSARRWMEYKPGLYYETDLPFWLNFNPTTRTFSGTPRNSSVGSIIVRVKVTDTSAASAGDTFTLTVQNVNDSPVLNGAVPDQSVTAYSPFSYAAPADLFTDPDPGDSLTWSATRADGSALPAWLDFDPATRTFSGTPTNLDVGALALSLLATDSDALSASDTFTLTVEPNHSVLGGSGNDLLYGTAGADTLSGAGGADTLVAGADNDRLVGGDGNDTLNGGAGADTMVGGLGDDTYVVDNPGDVIAEGASGGTDRVNSSITFSFNVAGRAELENLTLTGTNAINATGNAKANVLTGNAKANVLNGAAGNDRLVGGAGNDTLLGGAGADTLTGGLGADRFKFLKPANARDTITDFSSAQTDKLVFASPNFGALPVGTLAATRFRSNTTGLAGDADDRFIFETYTRLLWYDADGKLGTSAPVAMAKLNVGSLANTDIVIAAS